MLKQRKRKIRTKARQADPMAVAPTRVEPTPMQMAAPRPSYEEWVENRANAMRQVAEYERLQRAEKVGAAIGFALRGFITLIVLPFAVAFFILRFAIQNAGALMYAGVGIFFLMIVYMVLSTMWGAGLLW